MMKYSKYLGGLVRVQGAPNLSQSAYAKMMNVVHLEGKIEGFKRANKKLISTAEPRLLDLEMFQTQSDLTELTGNLEPREFVKGLIDN